MIWTHFLSLNLELPNFMSWKQASFSEDICLVSLWSYVSLWVSNKSGFLWKRLLTLSLKFCKFLNFKPMPIFKKTVLGSQFEVIQVYDFQTKPNSYQDIYWVLVSSYVSLCVSNKSGFLWRHLLSLSLDLPKCMSFKQKRILTETFFRSQFEVT